jgi:hypothetical protein
MKKFWLIALLEWIWSKPVKPLPPVPPPVQPPSVQRPGVTVLPPKTLTLAQRIVAAMEARNIPIARGKEVYEIVYVEGMNPDGTPNANRSNAFDDQRILLRVPVDGPPEIVGMWWATTEPGRYWTQNRMNPKGAFHIAWGKQTCWQMGVYHDAPALRQTKPILGTRDNDEDFKRDGDATDAGQFGVHHHGTRGATRDNMGRSSAGCQVGFDPQGHLDFIKILKTDARYRADPGFVFSSTVMPYMWLP